MAHCDTIWAFVILGLNTSQIIALCFECFNMAHTHYPKTQIDFLDLETFLVKVWGGGGVGVWYARPPPPPPPPKLLNFFWT